MSSVWFRGCGTPRPVCVESGLSDDLTEDLLSTLSEGDALETELRRERHVSRQTITRGLTELEVWGIVNGRDQRTPGRGRPTKVWRLTDDWITHFGDVADSAVLELLERRAARQREGIKRRTRARTRLVRPNSEAE